MPDVLRATGALLSAFTPRRLILLISPLLELFIIASSSAKLRSCCFENLGVRGIFRSACGKSSANTFLSKRILSEIFANLPPSGIRLRQRHCPKS